MKNTNTALTEIISTRISHDLIGNIGAVGNAVELLEEGDLDFLSDIKNILKVSSEVLSGRLKFFRMAFGLTNNNLENLEEVKKVSQGYIKTIGGESNGITLQLNLSGKSFNREAMLMVMSLTDLIIKGGHIEITESENILSGSVISERGFSEEKVKNYENLWQGYFPENMSLYAPGIYLREQAENKGCAIRQELKHDKLTIHITKN